MTYWDLLIDKVGYTQMLPTLHVITRTSGRPKFFSTCYSSVKEQSYPYIRHLVTSDDPLDTYVNSYNDVKLLKLKKEDFKHYNLYLNVAMEMVPNNDYVCFLDDDDYYTSKDSLSTAMGMLLEHKKDIIFWKVRAAGGTVPNNSYWKKPLVLGQISMIGFIVKKSFIESTLFPDKGCGDFHFIHDLMKGRWGERNALWVDKVLSSTTEHQRAGRGRRVDKKDNN